MSTTQSIIIGDTVAVRVGSRNGGVRTYSALVESVDGDFAVIRTPKGGSLRRRLATLTKVAA